MVFSSQLKSKVGNILTKSVALWMTLNIDGGPVSSRSHTHPSHSQTSRLLTSSMSLGVTVPHSPRAKETSTFVSPVWFRSTVETNKYFLFVWCNKRIKDKTDGSKLLPYTGLCGDLEGWNTDRDEVSRPINEERCY